MPSNANQSLYGSAVSTYQGKSAINALYAPAPEALTSGCNNMSNCSTLVSGGASQNITCGGTTYIIYYNSSSIDNATSFCAMNASNGLEITTPMNCSCMPLIYPSGSACQYYRC
jgi:hypothetical protein